MKRLYVLLIHGTWAGAGRWTHDGSPFRERLDRGLSDLGYKARFETFPWNGQNRWRARSEVANAVNDHLNEAISERDGEWEFLVVAHRHGGNIATEAVRDRLRANSTLPIRGVVCLNTPFLTHEVRGSSAYLFVWLLIALAFGGALWGIGGLDGHLPLPTPSEIAELAPYSIHSVPRSTLVAGLVILAVILVILLILSKRLQRHQHHFPWGPRPNVLCLSCPDDEAITFLGLGEGISNLPQLFLHPLALVLATTAAILLLYTSDRLIWCGQNLMCWDTQLASSAIVFVIWVGIALLGGILGACGVTLMFGLSVQQALASLVSRVLVSYMPLRPAQSSFRGISALSLRWGNPLQLLHSAIYRSPQTVEEICEWLKQQIQG